MPKKLNNPNIQRELSPELFFLISCCQTEPDFKDIASQLKELPDTKKIIALASRHGILPLVYKTLRHSKLDLNTNLLTELKSRYMHISQKNMLMTAELIKTMKLFKENNIEALAFKGPTLAQLAYGDITLRQYGDIDILVNKNNVYKAGEIITTNNYIPDADLTFLKNEALLNISSDLGFHHSTNNTYIELHWKLFRKKLSITLNRLNLYINPTIIEIQASTIRTLQSDLLLVYLCAHGSKHMWERIEWIVDIDRLIRNLDTINWDKVWEYAKSMHSINTLLLGLSLSRTLFHTEIPAMLEEKINQHTNISTLETYTIKLLYQNMMKQKTENSAMFKKFEYHANLYDSFREKSKYYFSTVFRITPDDILNINLPKHFTFLYFIIRPFRLAKKYIIK